MIEKSILEKAAQTLAEQFDYPWEHMPEQGRENMRKIAGLVIADAVEQCAVIGARTMEEMGRKAGGKIFADGQVIADAIREGANHET